MRKIAVFLSVLLIFLLPLTAFAEMSEGEESPVQALIRNSAGTVTRNAVLLIGGNPSQLWKDYAFDMYPHAVDTLTLEGSFAKDWTPALSSLSVFAPKGLVFCLSGEDTEEDVTALVTAFTGMNTTRVYVVSALTGGNLANVNAAADKACISAANVRYINAYSLMLNADGTVNPEYIGEKVTGAGLRLMAETVKEAVSQNILASLPAVTLPDTLEESVVVEEKVSVSDFKWLVPVVILVVGLIIGIDCARTASINERNRKAMRK